jgi:hypothetical protein
MTLRIDSERWCECVPESGIVQAQFIRCGDIAISICGGCGLALCEAHEILCPDCSAVTCVYCEHACPRKQPHLPPQAA